MSYLQWSDSFSVNVGKIDDQHKRLVEMLNSLHDAHIAMKGREAQKEIVAAMVDYARSHFDTEEHYMRQSGFPGYESHKVEHDRFTTKALELRTRVEEAGFIFTIEILEFLKNWLQEHILGTDMKYAAHFRQFGLS